jgi:anti-sigma factor RsiW
MALEAALSARLLGDPDYDAAMVGRIDWMRRPSRSLPATTLQIISDPRPQYMKGFQTRQTRVQLDIWSASPKQAAELREKAIAILTPSARIGGVAFQRAMVVNVRPGMDQQVATEGQPQGELYRESIDFIFTHNA